MASPRKVADPICRWRRDYVGVYRRPQLRKDVEKPSYLLVCISDGTISLLGREEDGCGGTAESAIEPTPLSSPDQSLTLQLSLKALTIEAK